MQCDANMKLLRLTLILFLVSNLSLAQQATIWLTDQLESMHPCLNELSEYGSTWTSDHAKGSFSDVHLVVKAGIGTSIQRSADLDFDESHNYWRKSIAVPVEENTGLDRRTEQFKGVKNLYAVRRAPFELYKVIKPALNERLGIFVRELKK